MSVHSRARYDLASSMDAEQSSPREPGGANVASADMMSCNGGSLNALAATEVVQDFFRNLRLAGLIPSLYRRHHYPLHQYHLLHPSSS